MAAMGAGPATTVALVAVACLLDGVAWDRCRSDAGAGRLVPCAAAVDGVGMLLPPAEGEGSIGYSTGGERRLCWKKSGK